MAVLSLIPCMSAVRVVAFVAVALSALVGCGGSGAIAAEPLPRLALPGPRGGPPGEYGWEGGGWGHRGGMHHVAAGREATAMLFEVGPQCLAPTDERPGTPVNVAGFDGVAVEPYLPPQTFNNVGDEITRAYRLAIADRTLCVFLTWHPTTTALERDAALRIVDTLRAQPIGADGVRITFTLADAWDTG